MKYLKKALLLSLLLISQVSFGQVAEKALRLFIIGNSFSQNATAYLPNLVKENNQQLVVGRAELGGHSLQQHWEYAEAAEANPEDPKGKPYNGKSLRMLLSAGTWDVVTMQQFSYLSADVDSYSPYAQKLYNYIKSLQPNAKILLHQGWAYRSDAKKFGRVAPEQPAKTQEEMWQKSRAAYHAVAKQLNVSLIPVGDAFNAVATGSEYRFTKDMNFDYDHPVFPNLPIQTNSINMGYYWKDNVLVFDPNHANEAGRYLGSLIWYAVLFKESPEKVKYQPKEVPAGFAAYLRSVAAKTVKDL
ncbi:DUF4886 domain-containing protein [Pedobacter sp. FW305-3-2-15-E-R2A2]|uniref:DUF4886 domain-containing protein n=1 Tax=Pedobacter sp. FW305-3-2-15-E-R2A2 TaxID=3140251 RepID=UPI003140039D